MFSSDAIVNTLLWTIGLGVLSTTLTHMLFKTWFSASTMYWAGWVFLLFGAGEAHRNSWYLITTEHFDLIILAHLGAFLGHITASLVARANWVDGPRQRVEFLSFSDEASRLLSKYYSWLLVAVFALGVANFFLKTGGANVELGTLRDQYNLREDSLIERIGNHLRNLVSVFVILAAARDSSSKLKVVRIAILVLALAPFNLANATRLFLVTFPAIYMVSFLLSRAQLRCGKLLVLGEAIKLFASVALLLSAFAIMGFLRGGYGDELDVYKTVLVWPVSTAWAFDQWVEIALQSDRTYGLNFFGLLGTYGDLVGFFDLSSARNVMSGIYLKFQIEWNTIAVIPRSAIPDLVLDFGRYGVLPGMLLYSFGAQFASLKWVGRGIFRHSVATLAVWSSFLTIQMSPFSPGNIALIVWALAIAVFIKRRMSAGDGVRRAEAKAKAERF